MSRLFLESCPKRHIVLHMDINKTIIQIDAAGGRTMEDVLNSNAAANVYGFVNSAGKWEALYGPQDTPVTDTRDREVITYDTYIDRMHRGPPGMQDLPRAERDALWKDVSGRRREMARRFTFPGEPGERFDSLVEEQRRALTVGAGPTYHSIVPSFFYLMNTLSELEWPFTLIFRTFGSDLAEVLKEWRRFVMGEHVCQPKGRVLAKLRVEYVEPLTGCVYRDHGRMFLCYGPSVSAQTGAPDLLLWENPTDAAVVEALRKYSEFTEVEMVDFKNFNRALLKYYALSNHIGGLVDYYPCWAQAAERRYGGKIFAAPVSSLDKDYFHVFFDDNIFLGDESSIVDLRDAYTGESVLGMDKERPFCVPVNAYRAIVDEQYFLDRLCERLKLQAGVPNL